MLLDMRTNVARNFDYFSNELERQGWIYLLNQSDGFSKMAFLSMYLLISVKSKCQPSALTA